MVDATMQVYCDESGNTGVDLLNVEQPLFALASTALDEALCRSMVAPLLRQNQAEAKYSKLKGTAAGQRALLQFFSSRQLAPETTKFMLADKRYYVITHLVDKLIEPPLHEAGHDLYAGDAHVGLVNVWYHAGSYIFPHGHWDKVLRAFVAALRLRNTATYAAFDRALVAASVVSRPEDRDFVTGLMLSRGRLAEFLEPFDQIETFDPAVDLFIDMINKWMVVYEGMLDVTHDRSKPLKRSEAFLRMMMKPLPSRKIGYGARQAELPLRVATFDFGDSVTHPQLQVADLVAGAAVDCLLAWSGKRPSSDYHEAMKATRLNDLFLGGMLPSIDIKRRNDPTPGQTSLVDGSAQFLEESGYFSARMPR